MKPEKSCSLRALYASLLTLGVGVSCGVVDDGSIDIAPAAFDGDAGPALRVTSQPLGQKCGTAAECASGFCADGVCCDTACAAPCASCNAATKQSGASGLCGFRKAGIAPKTLGCITPRQSPCAAETCNGHGICGLAQGTPCGEPALCLEHSSCVPRCTTSAQCLADCQTCPNGYTCHPTEPKCLGSCTTEAQCQPGYFCRNGACTLKLETGKSCTANAQCKTGNCYISQAAGVGRCCETDCATPCYTCFASEQQTPFGKDGVCGPTKALADFNGDCPKSSTECGPPGWCSGNGSCATQATNGKGCGNATCQLINGVPHVVGQQCQDGACQLGFDPAACEGVAGCDGDACVEGCTADADCVPSFYCHPTAEKCIKRKDPGLPCNWDAECSAGYCTDGFCCSQRCDGVCEACDLPGNEGMCVAVTGEPRGARSPCPGPGASGNPCNARVCDGVERKSCDGFVGQETVCAPESCTTSPYGSTHHAARKCDGMGNCSDANEIPCGATTCAGCFEKCTVATEAEICVPNAKCIDGECVLAKSCINEEQVASSTGAPVSCFPYVCRNDDCLTSCNDGPDCVSGAVCDVKTRACVTSPEASSEPGAPGCGCRVVPPSPGPPWWLVIALVLAGLRRRRA